MPVVTRQGSRAANAVDVDKLPELSSPPQVISSRSIKRAPSTSSKAAKKNTTTKTKQKRAPYDIGDDEDSDEVVEVPRKKLVKKSETTEEKRIKKKETIEERKVKKKETAEEKKKSSDQRRLKKWQDKPSDSFIPTRKRALSQRMFVIERKQIGAEEDPIEEVTLVGSTGNIYKVLFKQVPSCNCPHARYGNFCKHIIYVLARVLKAPEHMQYQLAFVPSEIRSILAGAPSLSSAEPSDLDGKRKPIEDDCPICCDSMSEGKEGIVWCKAACGQNMHQTCFQQWEVTKGGARVTCPYCRTPWQRNSAAGETEYKRLATQGVLNSEGYMNIGSQLGLPQKRVYYKSRLEREEDEDVD